MASFDPPISSSANTPTTPQSLQIIGRVVGGSRTMVIMQFVGGTTPHPYAEFLSGIGQCEFIFSERHYRSARDHAARRFRPLWMTTADLDALTSKMVDCWCYYPQEIAAVACACVAVVCGEPVWAPFSPAFAAAGARAVYFPWHAAALTRGSETRSPRCAHLRRIARLRRVAACSIVLLAVLVAAAAPLPAQTYCSSSPFSPVVQWIERVQLTNLDHSSTTTATGYQNQTAFSATLTPGLTSTLTVTASSASSSTRVRAYFDWNGDGSFTDNAGAFNLTLSGTLGAHCPYSVTITPPAGAVSPTRMRLILSTVANVPACGLYSQGETEDYTILIGPQLPPFFQTNQPGALFQLNGANGGAYSPTIVSTTANDVCTFGTVTVTWDSMLSLNPYELAFTSGALVAAPTGGAYVSSGGQIVNLSLSDPTFTFLFGGSFPPIYGVSFPFAPGGPYDISAQLAVIDATSVDGFAVSQAQSLHVAQVAPPGFPTVPLGISGYSVRIPGAAFGGCAIPFYGTTYSEVYLSTAGRFVFGGPNQFGLPIVPAATMSPGGFGVWCGLDSSYGSITLTSPATGILRVDFINVTYVAMYTTVNFSVTLDSTTGIVTVGGVAGLPLNPVHPNDQLWIGTTRGQGAIDAGPTNYSSFIGLGQQAGPTSPSAMVYQRGPEGTFAQGVSGVIFTPNAFGNYDFTVY